MTFVPRVFVHSLFFRLATRVQAVIVRSYFGLRIIQANQLWLQAPARSSAATEEYLSSLVIVRDGERRSACVSAAVFWKFLRRGVKETSAPLLLGCEEQMLILVS